MRFLLCMLLVILINSCKNNETENLKYEIKIKQQMINDLTKRVSELEYELHDLKIDSINLANNSTKYYFVVLRVTEDHITTKEPLNYTSVINEINEYNETIKYKILDEISYQYKRSPAGIAWKGSINDRQIYIYSTYEEASKEREKYFMNKNNN